MKSYKLVLDVASTSNSSTIEIKCLKTVKGFWPKFIALNTIHRCVRINGSQIHVGRIFDDRGTNKMSVLFRWIDGESRLYETRCNHISTKNV